ncbi:MAG: hypothetical protein ACOYXM_07580 [Actinomycetota bacterium]
MSRTEVVVTVGVALLGVLLGYLVKGAEFRRAERLSSYGAVAGCFVTAVDAGTTLMSAYMTFGESMRQNPDMAPLWGQWSPASRAFHDAAARMRLVASRHAVAELQTLEDFLRENVVNTPPFSVPTSDNPTAGWGEFARVGPRRVEEQSLVVARAFSAACARDFAITRR